MTNVQFLIICSILEVFWFVIHIVHYLLWQKVSCIDHVLADWGKIMCQE